MASAIFDDSGAKETISRATKTILETRGIASEHGARVLRAEIQQGLPYRTGFLRESLETTKIGKQWFLIIRKSKYERFFYSIMFLELIHELKWKASHKVRRATRSKFMNWFRSKMSRG